MRFSVPCGVVLTLGWVSWVVISTARLVTCFQEKIILVQSLRGQVAVQWYRCCSSAVCIYSFHLPVELGDHLNCQIGDMSSGEDTFCFVFTRSGCCPEVSVFLLRSWYLLLSPARGAGRSSQLRVSRRVFLERTSFALCDPAALESRRHMRTLLTVLTEAVMIISF